MLRARFPVWLIASLWVGAVTVPSSLCAPQNKPNTLYASKVPIGSEALRVAPRRTPPPARPDTVALPYNLIWGDTQNRLASLFAGVGAKITNKKTEGPNETWTVQGLIAPNLQASLFTFLSGQLAALEFDYGQPDWDLPKYNEAMGQFRRLLEAKCEAPGEIVTRESDQPAAEGIKQSFMGYQWKRGDTLVQLFYFSAEDPAKAMAFRSISVHYHYQDPDPPEPINLPANPGADPNLSPLFGGSAKPTPAPEPMATPGPAATAGPEPTPGASPAESPAESPTAVPAESPKASPTAPPAPTPKGARKKGKPKPTPEGDALPLPER